MRVTLLQQIKPEYVERIKASEYKYSSSVILAKLDSSSFYGELTINDIRDIYDMCDISSVKVSAWDIRYGDNILIEDNE